MNNRQKAKHFKRLYEGLLKSPVKYTVNTQRVERLRFKRKYPSALVACRNELLIKQAVVRDLAFQIAENIEQYVDYTTEYDARFDEYNFTAEINIVRINK